MRYSESPTRRAEGDAEGKSVDRIFRDHPDRVPLLLEVKGKGHDVRVRFLSARRRVDNVTGDAHDSCEVFVGRVQRVLELAADAWCPRSRQIGMGECRRLL